MNGIALTLGILFGLAAWLIILERRSYFSKKREDSREFAEQIVPLLLENKLREGLKCSKRFESFHIAAVVGAGLQVLLTELLTEDKASTVRRIQRAMD